MKKKKDDHIYSFNVRGSFVVDGRLKPTKDAFGYVNGFILPNGKEVQILGICLEVDEKKVVVSEMEMSKMGFGGLEYLDMNFQHEGIFADPDEVLDLS